MEDLAGAFFGRSHPARVTLVILRNPDLKSNV